jgi:hypothetical protein
MIDFISHYHLYIIVLLLLLCSVTLIYVFRFAFLILETEKRLTEAIDAIDEEYTEISKVLEKPVFFDSPEIRQVINSIENVRNTFLNISAYVIEGYEDIDEDEVKADVEK